MRGKKYHIKSRFWIATDEGTFLGEGRVALLREIRKTGSISSAAKALGISYRKAWKMIDIMNSQARSPLVERHSGGKRGGGTRVTKEGEMMIDKYLSLKEKCIRFVDETFKEIKF